VAVTDVTGELHVVLHCEAGADRSIQQIHEDTERDFILGPQEAREYGVVDTVVARRTIASLPDRPRIALSQSG